nr:hypothetical protein [Candidatus Woesearchaeota archaeon]
MKVKIEDLRKFAENFLSILDREKILAFSDLEANINNTFKLNKNSDDFIELSLRTSNFSTEAYTISYINPFKSGIPIDVKFNADLNYIRFIIKAERMIDKYKQFAVDPYGNLVQTKLVQDCNFSLIKEELQHLTTVEYVS